MIGLERDGPVFILRMRAGENRFNRENLGGINRCLDEVEKAPPPSALVTVGEGKFYSNGLDLNWLMGGKGADMRGFVEEVHQLFARILSFPRPTVAALNGHAFAGGAMLAMAHDFRVMREDRGYFCVPEVDLKLPPTEAMTALLSARLERQVLHEALVTGKRYGAAEALEKKIADKTAPEAGVLPTAVALAGELSGKDKAALGAIKKELYKGALSVLNRNKGREKT